MSQFLYPCELLPQPEFNYIKNNEVHGCGFVRETEKDIYSFRNEGLDTDYITDFIIGKGISSRDVFEMSMFLYGIFNENHFGIREDSGLSSKEWIKGESSELDLSSIKFNKKDVFPLFLEAKKLDNIKVCFSPDGKNKQVYILSFEHKPNIINFWHFQIFTEENNKRLSRDSRQSVYKRLAKHILETKICEAICKKEDIKPFLL